MELAISELRSGHMRDVWLDVQPPDADELTASQAKSRRKKDKAEKKESKHAERLHKKGKQCRLHLQARNQQPPSPASLDLRLGSGVQCIRLNACD